MNQRLTNLAILAGVRIQSHQIGWKVRFDDFCLTPNLVLDLMIPMITMIHRMLNVREHII